MIDPITMAMLSALGPPAYAMISTVPMAPAQDAAKAADTVDEIIAKFDKEYADFVAKYQAAETDEERQAVLAGGIPRPNSKFAELKELAKSHPGTEAAGKAAAWVLQQGRGAADGAWALDMLLADFIETDHIADVPLMLSGLTSKNVEALKNISENAKNDRARALAYFVRGQQLIVMSNAAKELAEPGSSGDPYMQYSMQGMDDDLKAKLSEEGIAAKCAKEGEKILEHCIKAYKDVEYYPGSGMMLGARAEGQLFEMRNLQIGMPVPDIEGVDAEGVAFKLSDYKGKVVMVDFWGFW